MPEAWCTVIVPTRQRINYLVEAIESVRKQTCLDWLCIVAVDGEDLETTRYLRKAQVEDPRISHLLVTNGGSAARVRNAALGLVETPYVAFLDDDDIWVDYKLALQHDFFIKNPDTVLSSGQIIAFGDREGAWPIGDVPEVMDADFLCSGNRIATSTVVMRTQAIRDAGGFRSQYVLAEDYDLWLSLTRAGVLRYLPMPLALYRVHAGGISRNEISMLNAVDKLLSRHYREGLFSRRAYFSRLSEIYTIRSRFTSTMFLRLMWKMLSLMAGLQK